jgi:hypothetical protein
MPTTVAIEDMRSVDPLAYIRAVGLRPEDSYGFLPLDWHDVTPYIWLYRDRAEYEQPRVKLPGPEFVKRFGPVEVMPEVEMTSDMPPGPIGKGLDEVIARAEQMQQAFGAGTPGGPDEPQATRIERIDKLREIGAINADEYAKLTAEARGGDAGPLPGGTEAAPAAKGAPQIVAHRIYPRIRMRASGRQLNRFLPRYRDALNLCPEDVYGVYPASIRSTASGRTARDIEWDDYWIIYRDRDEYAQGREAWAKEMDKKGRWPDPIVAPGVAEPGSAGYDGGDVEVEKDRWPHEKVVMRKKGADLADALREKIGNWGYEPEDSFGFCPAFDNASIYFGWRTR